MKYTYALQQLKQEEFDRLSMDDQGRTIRAIPQYFAVDPISGVISIFPRVPTNKRVTQVLVGLEDKDGRR